MDLSNIKVGDTVYIVPVYDTREKPYEAVVKVVGRKYITIDSGYYCKFDKETGVNSDWPMWHLYRSKKEYETECKKHDMVRYIMNNIEIVDFSYCDLESIYIKVKRGVEQKK